MSKLIDRLPILLEEAIEDLPYLKEDAENPEKDKSGSASNTLANLLRFTGVAEYMVNSDVTSFKSYLKDAGKIRMKLLHRFEDGEPVSKSYISMLGYKSLFTVLASGDFESSKKLAALIGERDQIEAEYDHPFDRVLGYALKSLVLNTNDQAEKIAQFKAITNESENQDFVGYVDGFDAIQNDNAESFAYALRRIISGHKKQCKGSGVFKDTEDEVLCVWGIGLVKLANARGLRVKFDDPLIPEELIK